jgi:hypothetical protein
VAVTVALATVITLTVVLCELETNNLVPSLE